MTAKGTRGPSKAVHKNHAVYRDVRANKPAVPMSPANDQRTGKAPFPKATFPKPPK